MDENAQYRNTETGEVYGGDFLMNAGLYLPDDRDYETKRMVFERCWAGRAALAFLDTEYRCFCDLLRLRFRI